MEVRWDTFDRGDAMRGPGEAELAELARLRKRFRGHRIFHEILSDRDIRYLAYRADTSVHPHTIITHDLAELRDELEQAILAGLARRRGPAGQRSVRAERGSQLWNRQSRGPLT